LQEQCDIEDKRQRLEVDLQRNKSEFNSLVETVQRYEQEQQVSEATVCQLRSELTKKEKLVSQLQFQIQDTGVKQRKASIDRVSFFLADPANIFAAPLAKQR